MNFIQLQVTDYNITLLLKLRYILLFKSFSILFFFVKLKKKNNNNNNNKKYVSYTWYKVFAEFTITFV